MAAKKKAKKKKSQIISTGKSRRGNKAKARRKIAKKSPVKSSGKKKATSKQKARPVKKAVTSSSGSKETNRRENRMVDSQSTTAKRLRRQTEGQAGDLQQLSNVARADSESVDELLEEGNAFEAGVIDGVERAEDADEGEVRTREVPEDDVPEEYLDKD